MKTIKILGVFILQKIIEIWQIVINKQSYRTPDSVIVWVRTLVYVPATVIGLYWWTELVWMILYHFKVRKMSAFDYYMTAFAVLFGLVVCCAILYGLYCLYIKGAAWDFRNWISSNWSEAKRKVEKK